MEIFLQKFTGRSRLAREAALLLALLTTLVGSASAQAPVSGGMLKGKVLNGTTGRPVTNVSVEYVKLSQGMEPVEIARVDASGNFQFTKVPAPGNEAGPPGLLRVDYEGATYSQPVLSGEMAAQAPMMQGAIGPDGSITVTVYDSGSDRDMYVVHEHAIFVRPRGSAMAVLEQVFIENASTPPRAYVNQQGTFRFTLPAKPTGELTVSLQGTAGMPIPQTAKPVPGVENSYTIDYPIRPGESMIRIQYGLDYQDPYDFVKTFDRLPEEVHVVTPGDMVKVNAEDMIPAGKDDQSGFSAFKMGLLGNKVNFRVSGEAPPEQVSANPDEGGGSLTPVPNPIHDKRWYVLAGLGLVLAAGMAFLYKKG
jgi:hypothetical protein